MSFYPGISLITLGVADVARARHFYERLGWRCSPASTPDVAFFKLNNIALALFGRQDLLSDVGFADADLSDTRLAVAQVEPQPGAAPAFSLSQNHGGTGAVDRALQEAVAAGGALLKTGQATSWGGYHGMVADPDGHVWEMAWNPHFPLAPDGTIDLPC